MIRPVAREGNITDTTHLPASRTAPARTVRTAAVVFLCPAAATAVCGIPAGFAWGAVAPRVLVQVVGPGTAEVVNPETSAFIVADVWFCLIGVIGGLLTGSLGYLIAVRRWGPAAAAGLIAGALAAASVALWIGGLDGQAAFRYRLPGSASGTHLHASLALGAKSGLAFWPLLAALTIGAIEIVVRSRSARAVRPRAPAAQPP